MNDSSWPAELFERELLAMLPASHDYLYAPLRTIVASGGKRARPQLVFLAAANERSQEDSSAAALQAAIAIELLHTFTLIHDDIMDRAPTRRGVPTIHTTHGVNTAILAGDVLIAVALEGLGRVDIPRLHDIVREYAAGFRFVCEGQATDKEFEGCEAIQRDDYMTMIDLKTAKIFELAAVMGSLAAGGIYAEALRSYAHHIGLAFQINDDVLDLTAIHPGFGKTPGGDIIESKRTILFALTCERMDELTASDRRLFAKTRDGRATADDVPAARDMMTRTGILEEARELATRETRLAEAALAELPDSHAKDELLAFGQALLGRDR